MRHPQSHKIPRALTLLELILVLLVLVGLAGLIIPQLSTVASDAGVSVAKANLYRLRDIIIGSPGSPGYSQQFPAQPIRTLSDLLRRPAGAPDYDPVTRQGWLAPLVVSNGTYVINQDSVDRGFTDLYAMNGDPALLDPWGNPFILQRPTIGPDQNIRLVSAGPNGKIDSLPTWSTPDELTQQRRRDDLVLFLRVHDPNSIP